MKSEVRNKRESNRECQSVREEKIIIEESEKQREIKKERFWQRKFKREDVERLCICVREEERERGREGER